MGTIGSGTGLSNSWRFDGCSLERHSFLLDLKSIALTFVKVVKKEGITH